MKYNIRGQKIEITPAIRSYIEQKLGRLDKYFVHNEDITANVVIRINGLEQISEVTIPAGKMILRAEERNKDLYAAIDLVTDKLERQIRKNKTRLKKRENKTENFFNVDFEVEEDQEAKVVKRKTLETKPMSEEEALLQMNLLGHDFFLFKDSESGNTCVLYLRKDGNYGIIETK